MTGQNVNAIDKVDRQDQLWTIQWISENFRPQATRLVIRITSFSVGWKTQLNGVTCSKGAEMNA